MFKKKGYGSTGERPLTGSQKAEQNQLEANKRILEHSKNDLETLKGKLDWLKETKESLAKDRFNNNTTEIIRQASRKSDWFKTHFTDGESKKTYLEQIDDIESQANWDEVGPRKKAVFSKFEKKVDDLILQLEKSETATKELITQLADPVRTTKKVY